MATSRPGIKFKFQVRGQERLMRKIGSDRFKRTLRRWGKDAINTARQQVNIEVPNGPTGALKNNVRYDFKVTAKTYGMLIIPLAPHAKWVERGTKPHTITPKNAQALAWRTEGAKVFMSKTRKGHSLGVSHRQARLPGKRGPKGKAALTFAKEVNHPGIDAGDHFERALAKAKPRLQMLLKQNLKAFAKHRYR